MYLNFCQLFATAISAALSKSSGTICNTARINKVINGVVFHTSIAIAVNIVAVMSISVIKGS